MGKTKDEALRLLSELVQAEDDCNHSLWEESPRNVRKASAKRSALIWEARGLLEKVERKRVKDDSENLGK